MTSEVTTFRYFNKTPTNSGATIVKKSLATQNYLKMNKGGRTLLNFGVNWCRSVCVEVRNVFVSHTFPEPREEC